MNAQTATVSIDDILASLERRGFYEPSGSVLWSWKEAAQTQVDAVLEELAEVARKLRRDRQEVALLDFAGLSDEAADVVIAAVCLLGAVVGANASEVIRAKMEADEKRGYKHNGTA